MKLKSLLLGSAAALALTSGAYAADPQMSFVSLDVCDAYGITGLTIASSDTCLKISGSVDYQFQWGDYASTVLWLTPAAGARNLDDNDGTVDWRSRLETLLTFAATTQTDAGAAKATIQLRQRSQFGEHNGAALLNDWDSDGDLIVNEAWVSFGDTTVLMAGKKGSIAKLDNDAPFNYLGLVNSQSVDTGVLWSYGGALRRGGHVIQIVSEVADGISVGAGLESLDGTAANSRGTFVGFVEAKGGWGDAHATLVVGDILAGAGGNPWGVHTGATLNFDNFKVRGALAADDTGYWNALLSGEAAFDLFTIALSGEFNSADQLGLGASVGFQATETVKINAGFRWFDEDTTAATTEGWQAALQVVADVAEGITASAAVGVYDSHNLVDPVAYVDLGVAYKPGGGFETGVGLEANALGAYKLKFNAKKTF